MGSFFILLLEVIFFLFLTTAESHMEKSRQSDLSSLGLEVKEIYKLEYPAQKQFRLWTVDKTFLTEESIVNFHDFCGSEQVNKFVHFVDQAPEDVDDTRNCTYYGDFIIVNTTYFTPPDPEMEVSLSYKIAEIKEFFIGEGGTKQVCSVQDISSKDHSGIIGGIRVTRNIVSGKTEYELVDIPETTLDILTPQIQEDYMYFHLEDFTGADAGSKDCVRNILSDHSAEKVRESCRIKCAAVKEKLEETGNRNKVKPDQKIEL